MKKYILKHKGLFSLSTLFIIIKALCNAMFALVIRQVIDIGSKGNLSALTNWLIIVIAFSVAEASSCFFMDVFKSKFKQGVLTDLKNDLFKKILGRDIQHFNDINTAEYISILTNDINIIEQDYYESLFKVITNLAVFIIGTVTLINVNIYGAISIFLIGIVMLIIPAIFSKKLKAYKSKYSKNLSTFTIKIKDMFSGFEIIKSYHIEDKTICEFEKSNCEVESSKKNSILLESAVSNLGAGIPQNLMILVTLVVSCYFVIQGKLTIGSLFASLQLTSYTLLPLSSMVANINKIKSVKDLNNKILNILQEEDRETIGVQKDTFDGTLSFKDITFSYDNNETILNGLSLNIEKGKKYAIVGGSGSGKSTLIKLLLKYYGSYQGTISIDGSNIKDIKSSSLYGLISIIHQNVFMFDDSIKNNIALFNNYSKEEIDRAVALSGLSNYIDKAKKGIESQVGENGCYLSGGEKQRVAIARAIIKQTPIMVLDEATSSLDNETAYNIENAILSLDYVTSIVITHKLVESILKRYDKIIVLKNGTIQEIGTFDELIDQNGYFYSLYNVNQANGCLEEQ